MTGWTATTLLMVCAIPQVYKTVRTGHVRDISILMWWTYLVGHIFALIYAALIYQPPLLAKYIVNIIISITIIVLYYRLRDKYDSK